jgi:hypothetical protein
MPQKLTVKSLRFEWSTRTTHCSSLCDIRTALQALQHGDLFTLFADDRFKFAALAEQLNQQSFKL